MTSDSKKDQVASHAVVNYLYSGHQGRYAFLNALQKMESAEFAEEALEECKRLILEIRLLREQLLKGQCIISASWTSPLTFESKRAVELLTALRAELLQCASAVGLALLSRDLDKEPDSARRLIAGLARYAYTKDHFVKSFVQFGETQKLPELVERYTNGLQGAAADLAFAHDYLNGFLALKDGDNSEFMRSLVLNTIKIPGTLRAQAHEILQITAVFSGGFGFESLGLSDDLTSAWKGIGASPTLAGYWNAYEFLPEEAFEWTKNGFGAFEAALMWRFLQFTPAEARSWAERGFVPLVASQWRASGHSAESATHEIKEREKIERLR